MLLSGRRNRLFLAGALLVGVGLITALWLISREQERLLGLEAARGLIAKAHLLADVLGPGATASDDPLFHQLVQSLQRDGILVAVLDQQARIRMRSPALSDAGAAGLSIAPEVIAALRPGGAEASDTRTWEGGDTLWVAVAVPIPPAADGERTAVWLARPQWLITEHPGKFGRFLAAAAVVATLAAIALIALYLRFRRRGLARVVTAVRELSAGNLASQVPHEEQGEFAVLSVALNQLRRRFAAQVGFTDRQRRMLQSLVDQLQEGVIVARDDGRIGLINPTAMRMLNLTSDRGQAGLIGEPVEHCIQDHRLQHMLLPELPAAIPPRGTLIDDEGTEARLEIESEDGPIYLLARASEVLLAEPGQRTADGHRGRVVLLTDITELERIIQMRTDFVANASHELRTPLSTIRAAVETLLSMDLVDEGPAARTFLEKIDRHSNRLEAMVSDLLDLSKLETPSERFLPEELDCRRLLMDLYARFAELLERKGLHWHAGHTPPGATSLYANPHLLRLVTDNLVDNATKFTDRGGYIRVSIAVQPESASLTIADTGCGIPEDDLQRVFERFYQVQRARSGAERGTGLGLSIVRHAVNAMRGTVELHSTLGEGTQVVVTIPQVGLKPPRD